MKSPFDYEFADTQTCGSSTTIAGKNSNRTRVLVNGAVRDTFCYDDRDRLTSRNGVAFGYDDFGRTASGIGKSFSWDERNQHVSTTTGGITVGLKRDGSGRVVERIASGEPMVRQSFTGPGDSATFTLNNLNVVTDYVLALPGGVGVTVNGVASSAGGGGSGPTTTVAGATTTVAGPTTTVAGATTTTTIASGGSGTPVFGEGFVGGWSTSGSYQVATGGNPG